MINFKISEFIKSDVATKNNIDNMPNIKVLDNILFLITNCLQPIRNCLKVPIVITSGYRCQKLNEIIKGAKNSQHLIGEAADFITKEFKPDEIIKIINTNNLEFDQLINEHNRWVHISYSKNKNRKQIIYLK